MSPHDKERMSAAALLQYEGSKDETPKSFDGSPDRLIRFALKQTAEWEDKCFDQKFPGADNPRTDGSH